MRINTEITGGVRAVRSNKETAPTASSKSEGTADSKDVVSVSSTAQLAAAARDGIAEIPTVRTSIVEAIKNQFDNGTYQPNNDVVVDRLLREHFAV
jgi:flagellar biosynthesis anti-sigma factor FlgM